MQKYLAFAASLTFAGAALADGPGIVTAMISNGGVYPYAEKFKTNNGPSVYCFSTRDPDYQGELRSETLSYMTHNYTTNQEPLSFEIAPSNPDCGGAITVNRLQLGQ